MPKKKKPNWNPTWGKMESEINSLLREIHEGKDWNLAKQGKRTLKRFKALRKKMED